MVTVVFTIVMLTLAGNVHSQNGVCTNRIPSEFTELPGDPETTGSPFTINVEQNVYGPNQQVDIQVSKTSETETAALVGFALEAQIMVKALNDTARYITVGRFSDTSKDTEETTCTLQDKSGHKFVWTGVLPQWKIDRGNIIDSPQATWSFSENPMLPVTFRATFVVSDSQSPSLTFWTDVESEEIRYEDVATDDVCTNRIPSEFTELPGEPETTGSPFTINVGQYVYGPNQQVDIQVSKTTETETAALVGFALEAQIMVEALTETARYITVGRFSDTSMDTEETTCTLQDQSGDKYVWTGVLSQWQIKEGSIIDSPQATWYFSENPMLPVTFRATFVVSDSQSPSLTFWTDVESEEIRYEDVATGDDKCAFGDGRICDQTCTNTDGSFICSCNNGYTLNGDGYTCNDNDECADDGGQTCDQTCINTDGSFTCSCNSGYTLDMDGYTCNECPVIDDQNCDQTCINTDDGFICSCHSGYTLDGDGHTCNECTAYNGYNCDQTCSINSNGFATCSCNSGYTLGHDGHTCNECTVIGGHTCDQTCSIYTFFVTCSCNSGYTLDQNGHTCNDIDECAVDGKPGGVKHNCDQMCANIDGSFTCSCDSGYTLDEDGHTCNDYDECADDGGHTCDQTCTNTDGSFSCSCNSRYTLDGDGYTCNDIDECAVDGKPGGVKHNCDQMCANIDGSFTCSCDSGYTLDEDGHTCNDYDECADDGGHTCDQTCTNTDGSFICSCNSGYTLDGDGYTCNDDDECDVDGGNNCHQMCANTDGSFTCFCNSGYTLIEDGYTCNDDDECAFGGDHTCDQTCTNTAGSFICSCNSGYTLDGNGYTCNDNACSPPEFITGEPEETDSPFTIDVNSTVYGPNQQVQVSIQFDTDRSLVGFVLQAQTIEGGATDTATVTVGTFASPSTGTRAITCPGDKSIWTGYIENEQALEGLQQPVKATWFFDAHSNSPVKFSATVASVNSQSVQSVFWTNVESEELFYENKKTAVTTKVPNGNDVTDASGETKAKSTVKPLECFKCNGSYRSNESHPCAEEQHAHHNKSEVCSGDQVKCGTMIQKDDKFHHVTRACFPENGHKCPAASTCDYTKGDDAIEKCVSCCQGQLCNDDKVNSSAHLMQSLTILIVCLTIAYVRYNYWII